MKLRTRTIFLNLACIHIALLGAMCISSCGGSDDGKLVAPDGMKYFLGYNASSSAVAGGMLKDGTKITAFGTKTGSGKPIAITEYSIERPNGDMSRMRLDAQAKPALFTSPRGTTVTFDWTSETTVKLSVRSIDGVHEIQTVVDLAGGGAMKPLPMTAKQGRRQGEAHLAATYGEGKPCQADIVRSRAEGSTVVVNVQQCGLPAQDGLSVYVNLENGNGHVGTYPALANGSGSFVAQVPSEAGTITNPQEICSDAATALSAACYLYNSSPLLPFVVCNGISAALAASGVGLLLAPEFDAACLALGEVMQVFCKWVNVGPDPSPNPASPTLASLLCDALPLPETVVGDVTINAFVSALPAPVHSAPVTVHSGSPYPSLAVDLGGETTIRSLTLNPSAPLARQGYIATADVFCLPAGTQVTLSIVGTDGYSDSKTTVVSEAQASGTFALSVPGAESAVRDVVTTRVEPPSGPAKTLEASLIFQ